jgi:hypothetical protein
MYFWISLSLERETASISIAGDETREKDDSKQRTSIARGANGSGRLDKAFLGLEGDVVAVVASTPVVGAKGRGEIER